jgi:LPXTG-motif cell wall-anchored protein
MKRINLIKRTAAAFGLGMMLAMAPLAMAQEAPPPDPGMADAGGQSSGNNELGSIDTSQPSTSTTTTTTNTTSGDYQVVGDDSAPLPNTGGEPLLFVLAGSMLIGGGWALRRKMTQTES